jgi:hypothetical protein
MHRLCIFSTPVTNTFYSLYACFVYGCLLGLTLFHASHFLEKDYEMSFVLSGTDWKDSYNDLSDPESEELKEKVLTAVSLVKFTA